MENSIASGATPGFIPTGLLPIIENIANYSFFQDRPIVPRGKEPLPAPAQFTTYTSETAKKLGEIFNYSPAKVDNLINGYFAGLGKYAVNMIDLVLESAGISPKINNPRATLADMPGLKAFMIREPIGSASESVNRFYNIYNSATAGDKYVKELIKSQRTKEAEDYANKHPEIRLASSFAAIAKDISNINRTKEAIYNSKLSPEEKRDKINLLDRAITTIAQNALKMSPNK